MPLKVAIVGSGISGLSAAFALKDAADITVFEKRSRAGGHSCTRTVDYDGTQINVDVGFIVYNATNYPNLIALLDHLDVKTQASDMSFAVSNPDGYEWASNPKGLFAWKRNLFSPKFHAFWRTILKFNDLARAELEAGQIQDATLGEWLDRHSYTQSFRDNYILPMGAAIWSTPEQDILDYPALSFFNFFQNHRLMHRERPKWRTVSGGSINYVEKLRGVLGTRVQLNADVRKISRAGDTLAVAIDDRDTQTFDRVILASHSDQSHALLSPDFDAQRTALSSVRYRPNTIYLHRDPALMPKRKAAWAAWNVLRQPGGDICLTYWMNILQGLPKDKPLFVTLNPATPPAADKTFAEFNFDHPQFDRAAAKSVATLQALNGQNGLWLAGAWMGSGFHEDGLKSGLNAALSLGGKVPWAPENLNTKPDPFVLEHV